MEVYMNSGRKAGIFGIGGIAVLLICAVISAVSFEDGAFDFANRFISELGLYYHGYFVASPALVFNIGLIISGLALVAFAVLQGIQRATAVDAAAGFFGILSGVSLAAQGVVTLNYSTYHILISGAFFASVFIMCLLTVIAQIRSQRYSIAVLIPSFLAGAAAALSAVYIFTGGLDKTFGAGVSYASRAAVMPCAILQWGVYVMFALTIIIESGMLLSGSYEQEEFEPEVSDGQKRWRNKRDIEI
jgi:hypothetical membrane protein